MRVARPTDHLEDVVRFYVEGLGFEKIGSFIDHQGFDGVIVGLSSATYHLEFTHQRGHTVRGAPTQENLLVFYLPDAAEWRSAVDRMVATGNSPVAPHNPYWSRNGRTFEDPDGYRVVLQHAAWPNGEGADRPSCVGTHDR